MQHVVEEIFEALDGVTAVARGINAPVQTVDAWLGKGRSKRDVVPAIPSWRRSDVLRFAAETGKLSNLSQSALEYLQTRGASDQSVAG